MGGSRGEDKAFCGSEWPALVNKSSYTDVGRMRRELGRLLREGLMRHEGSSSCWAIAGEPAAFEGTSSTVRARERAVVGARCESILRSSEAASGPETELIE